MYVYKSQLHPTPQPNRPSHKTQNKVKAKMKFAPLALLAALPSLVSAIVPPGASTPLFYLVSSSSTSSANLLVSPFSHPFTLALSYTYPARPPRRHPLLLLLSPRPILLLPRLPLRPILPHLLPTLPRPPLPLPFQHRLHNLRRLRLRPRQQLQQMCFVFRVPDPE